MSRALAAFLATPLLAATALAQTPAPAPATHPGTKLNFAPTLGSATFEQSAVHGATNSYRYSAGKIQVTIQVFDGGRRVPSGSANPTVVQEFTAELAEADQQARNSGLTGFERPPVPSACSYGSVAFRCIVYSANSGNGRLYGKMLLTGYHDYFLKILAEWTQLSGQTAADADKVLESFVPALVR